MKTRQHLALLLTLCLLSGASFAQSLEFDRYSDIIYRKQEGYALTLDRLTPKKANGAGIIVVMSGGWFSNHQFLAPHKKDQIPGFFKENATELLKRGYSLFYVVHGTQPKFTIKEIHDQISAAVRFIRHNAKSYGIEPQRIGITGASAGGHLSLMQGTKGSGDAAKRSSNVAGESSRVQAVVSYFPPTDFVNYGAKGVFFDKVVRKVSAGRNPFLQALDLLEFDSVNIRLNKVTDEKKLAEHYKNIAPYYHVTKDDPPALILHGDADKLVPIQQAEHIIAKYKEVGVPHKLFVEKGGNHGWKTKAAESKMIGEWFDEHLKGGE